LGLRKNNTYQLHSPDGKKRGSADAASLGEPLVMHGVGRRHSHPFPTIFSLSLYSKFTKSFTEMVK